MPNGLFLPNALRRSALLYDTQTGFQGESRAYNRQAL